MANTLEKLAIISYLDNTDFNIQLDSIDHDWMHNDEMYKMYGGPVATCLHCRHTKRMD